MLKLLAFFFFAASSLCSTFCCSCWAFRACWAAVPTHNSGLLFNGTLHPLRVQQLSAVWTAANLNRSQWSFLSKSPDFIVLRLCAKVILQTSAGFRTGAHIPTQRFPQNTVKLLEIVTILMSSFKQIARAVVYAGEAGYWRRHLPGTITGLCFSLVVITEWINRQGRLFLSIFKSVKSYRLLLWLL